MRFKRMRQNFKQMLALGIVAVSAFVAIASGTITYAADANPTQFGSKADFQLTEIQKYTHSNTVRGKVTGLTTRKPVAETSSNAKRLRLRSASLPSSYDLRTTGGVTAVRDQGTVNDCWAYAANASVESNLAKLGEQDYFDSDYMYNISPDLEVKSSGGDEYDAMQLFSAWRAPVNKGTTSPVQKHVENMDELPSRTWSANSVSNVDTAIKEAVMDDGAVFAGIYAGSDTDVPYDSTGKNWYESDDTLADNHAVAIVGWDNSYARTNFSSNGSTPDEDGAFICKDSWGTSFGDNGYIYVSYADACFGQTLASFNAVKDTDDFTGRYSHDDIGMNASIRTDGAASVFVATSSAQVSAMQMDFLSPGDSYTIYGGTGSPANVGKTADGLNLNDTSTVLATGTETYAGVHTITFNTSLNVSAGQPYFIKIVTASGVYPLTLRDSSEYTDNTVISTNESFTSFEQEWYDMATQNSPVDNTTNSCVVAMNVYTKAASTSSNSSSSSASSVLNAPAHLSATADDGQVGLSWDAVDGATGYHVYIGTQSGKYTSQPAASVTGTNVTITGLTDGKTYYFVVKAVANAVESNASNEVAASPVSSVVSSPRTDIDTPAKDATVSGIVNVSGWVLNSSGISRVDVYAWDSNGTPYSLGSVAGSKLTNRSDVASAFAKDGYANINNSGYTLSVDTTKLSGGAYTLAVAGIGNNGVVQWATETIHVTTPQPMTDIDTPANGTSVTGTINVSGWALNVSGISRVDVYAWDSNGTPHSLGSVAGSKLANRSDVASVFAKDGYANINNSGYTLPVDTTKLASGAYRLAAAGIGNNGTVQWATKSIYVTTPQSMTDIDTPADGVSVSGTINVSGWALNASGISRVDVYAWDNNGTPHSLGSVAGSKLTNRSDVAHAFASSGYKNINNSGYTLPVDTTKLVSGAYRLAAAGIGNNGTVQWATKSIHVTTPQPMTDIDTPADGASVSGTMNVSGWVLNVSGISRVDIYAWDSNGKSHALGSVAGSKLTNRSDVAHAFTSRGYANINKSGYTLSVDTTQFTSGAYTLAVAGIGNNGVVQWSTVAFAVQ